MSLTGLTWDFIISKKVDGQTVDLIELSREETVADGRRKRFTVAGRVGEDTVAI